MSRKNKMVRLKLSVYFFLLLLQITFLFSTSFTQERVNKTYSVEQRKVLVDEFRKEMIKVVEGIYVAVTRHTADGKNPNGLIPEEKLTVEEAVQCYTMNAAHASYQEEKVGSIEPGKFADLVILSENIFEIDPIKIRDAKVITTVFDGEIIYTIN